MSIEFLPFPKIERLNKVHMSITQKIHGTNAQVFIFKKEDGILDLKVGSRTRWITPESDNYGFAAHVYTHKEEFIEKLGIGQHFGEWAGPGINSGEGLTERLFILFDHQKFQDGRPLPNKTITVPVLYSGKYDLSQIQIAMDKLKNDGSKLITGFMRPEGIVVLVNGIRNKVVFEAEETAWQKGDGTKGRIETIQNNLDVAHLFQPIRLQKLLSKDEQLTKNYPKSLGSIASLYIHDLIEEGQITGNQDELKAYKKAMGKDLFKFIKHVFEMETI